MSKPPATPQSEPSGAGTVDYRLSPALTVRLVGFVLAATAVVMFAGSLLLAWAELPFGALVLLVGIVIVVVFGGAWWITRRAYVVRLTEQGYRVRFVRGAGATRARWSDVEQAVTTTVAGAACLVLRLRDGRSTTIPVSMLGVSSNRFAKDVRARLREGRDPRRTGRRM